MPLVFLSRSLHPMSSKTFYVCRIREKDLFEMKNKIVVPQNYHVLNNFIRYSLTRKK